MNTDTDTNDAVTEHIKAAAQEAMPHKCPKCTKRFTSKAGLAMHNMRVHTGQLKAPGQKGFKPNPNKRKHSFPSDSAAVKRKKYQQMRDRFHAMGLDAKGRPFKSEYGRRTSLAMRGKGPQAWTPERRAKFKATWRRKEREKAGAQLPGGKLHPNSLTAKKRIQFVYPTPEQHTQDKATMEEAIANTWPNPERTTTAIRFCPHCGNNIERHL
jgi:predicted RNA-binding Zn-ribbon protein involved in translation (DUF1610 family)